MSDLLLVGHGSRDPRAQAATAELAAAVQSSLGPDVRVGVGYLELAEPAVGAALDLLRRPVVVQPLLFAPAYHATADLPRQLAGRAGVVLAPVLAVEPARAPPVEPPAPTVVAPLLLDALDRRLGEALGEDREPPDGLVLACAGTTDDTGRTALDLVTDAWAARHGVAGLLAHTSGEPDVQTQVLRLRVQGCRRVAVGSLFVAPGRLPTAAREAALGAGAVAVAEPLGSARELVQLIAGRHRALS